MHSKIWGKYGWYLLHSTAYLYEPEKKQLYMRLLNSYRHILPCPICRKHFSQKLDKMGNAMKDRDSYVQWLIGAHNSVNSLFRRPHMNKDQVKRLYYRNDKLYIDKTQYLIFGQFILAEAIKRNGKNQKEFINFFSIVPKILDIKKPSLEKKVEEDKNKDNNSENNTEENEENNSESKTNNIDNTEKEKEEYEPIKTLSDSYKWAYYFTDANKERYETVVKNTMDVFADMLSRIPTTYEMYEWTTKTILNEAWFSALKSRITNNPLNSVQEIVVNGYRKYLNRDPDKGGFKNYFRKLVSGRINVNQFYNELKNSKEGRKISQSKS